MTTNNAVNTGLSGTTGTVNFVGSTSPTLITPILGAATATSITFSPTTSGIIGTITNDNAASGKVGEFISSTVSSGSAISLSNVTPINVTSISLTAGDWDVWGNLSFIESSTSFQSGVGWTNTVSASLPDQSLLIQMSAVTGDFGNLSFTVPQLRYSLSTTTTVYLSAEAGFSNGSITVCGGIYARRVR